MRSIRIALALAASVPWPGAARAQQQAPGFAVERLYLSGAGAGWIVSDDLSRQGGLGGAASLSVGYARRPLQVDSRDGSQRVSVVESQAFADVGLAAFYDRFRVWMSFASPLYVAGQSATIDGWHFTAPAANVEQNPDTIADLQIGASARVFGDATGPSRLGLSAALVVPTGDDAKNYLTDGTVRAMGRLLFAGDAGAFAYASQLGVHARPDDQPQVRGSPRGSELLFGAAFGLRLAVGTDLLVVGPEVFGATAFRSFFDRDATALEGLFTARYERSPASRVRFKLGLGAGLHPQFGAPEWRVVLATEVLGQLLPEKR